MRSRARRVVAWALVVSALLPTAPARADEPAAAIPLRFRLPDDAVVFRGTSPDTPGLEERSMLYPGGPIGLVTGIVLQSVLTERRRRQRDADLQAKADDVLLPYADALARFDQRALLERSFGAMKTGGDKRIDRAAAGDAGWIVSYAPVFTMPREGQAVVLDNAVSISRSRDAADVPVRLSIRVVSTARPGDDPEEFWGADDARQLKEESAALLAASFDVAIAEAGRGDAKPAVPPVQQTLRYRFGNAERMERAELLAQSCDRIVMRTLRGAILSAPSSRPPARDGAGRACPTADVAPS